jgi:hypothetical protein
MLRRRIVGVDQQGDVGFLFGQAVAHSNPLSRPPVARHRGMTTGWRAACAVDERRMIASGTKRLLNACKPRQQGASVRKDETMRKLGLAAALAASVAVTGCATYPDQYGYGPYGYNNGYYNNGYYGQPYYGGNSTGANVATGAALGAATGAVAGAVLPGVSAGQGAIAGAILGGVLGATVNGRQYYRDTRGYCYYVDQYGQPHYSYDIRC